MATKITAAMVRSRLGLVLKRVADDKERFLITKSGKPAAVLIGVEDFDDILEELDPEFQRSLKVAYGEYQAGRALSLKEYGAKRSAIRKAG